MVDVTSGTPKLIEGTQPTNVTGTVKTGTYSDYIPHPAFEFDGAKAGIWVGKYEPSGSTSKISIIPNVASLRSTSVSNMFTASQGLKTTYSLTSDSHMMKNTEWGAVAYLTESKYGRNGTEVSVNTSSSYYTGGGTGDAYKTNTAQSTTGNIYGIYDMSGGAYEYTMGALDDGTGVPTIGSSGFTSATLPESKYYDLYTRGITPLHGTSNYAANADKKGDAMYETSTAGSGSTSWYGDYSSFVVSNYPWFNRGGSYVTTASSVGLFFFNYYAGNSLSAVSFRVVCVAQ